ncbi:MAG: metal-sulfur cluster assembly factor [bacterium]
MVTKDAVMKALSDVMDPELGVSLVDLGLIYDVNVEDDKVEVKMTLTAPGCPLHSVLRQNAQDRIAQIEGVKDANVQVVWDPPWKPEMMSEKAKKQLGFTK